LRKHEMSEIDSRCALGRVNKRLLAERSSKYRKR
jgi:hypothetical protein